MLYFDLDILSLHQRDIQMDMSNKQLEIQELKHGAKVKAGSIDLKFCI